MLKQLSVRLLLPILFVGAVMMALGLAAAMYVHREYQARSEFIAGQIISENSLQDLVFTVRDTRYLLREFLLTGDVKHIEQARQLEPIIRQRNQEAEKYVQTDQGRELIRQIEIGTQLVFGELKQLTGMTIPAMRQETRRIVDDVLEPKLRIPGREYLELKHERVESGLAQAEEFSQVLVLSLTILALCGATAGALWGLAVARGVGRSIVQLTVPIKSAAGQLSRAVGPLTVQTHWKFEELPEVVDDMARQIGNVIQQMRDSQTRAARSEQLAAAGQLAAGMAHELRNPLTSMKLLVQSAQMRNREQPQLSARDLEILGEEIGRLERVSTAILDYARPPRLHFTEFDLVGDVRTTAELMSDRYRRRNVDLVTEFPAGPCSVRGDSGQLRQVWLNLLLNALEASEGGTRVSVSVRGSAPSLEAGGVDGFVVEVADEGCGLPKDKPDFFEPFVSTKETGMGLGLSISRRIVEAHGGSIAAEDRPQRGTVIRVFVPARSVEDDDEVAETAAEPQTAASAPR